MIETSVLLCYNKEGVSVDMDFVSSLISCEKAIKTAPRKNMYTDQKNEFTFRNDFTCISDNGETFEVFMRMNKKLPYLFSIGLRYRSVDGTFTLCRYNGKHPHRNKIANRDRLNDFHIHKLYDVQLSDGTDNSLDAETTTAYATFDEALFAFLSDCHIKNWQKYFPDLEDTIGQMRLDGV